jgi:hypothetical protein
MNKNSSSNQADKVKFKDKLKSYLQRCGADTPPFFKKLRLAGVIVAAAGTAVVTAPVALPALVLAIGGYLIVGGTVATAVSQAAIKDNGDCDDEDHFQPLAH